MTRHELVETTPEHIEFVAAHLRFVDKHELDRIDKDPHDAITYARAHAPDCQTWLVDGVPAAIFGVGITKNGAALPFIYATPLLDKHKLTFVKGYRRILADVLKNHPVIEGVIEASRKPYLRWLKALGFSIAEPEWIANGTFCRFSMRAA